LRGPAARGNPFPQAAPPPNPIVGKADTIIIHYSLFTIHYFRPFPVLNPHRLEIKN